MGEATRAIGGSFKSVAFCVWQEPLGQHFLNAVTVKGTVPSLQQFGRNSIFLGQHGQMLDAPKILLCEYYELQRFLSRGMTADFMPSDSGATGGAIC